MGRGAAFAPGSRLGFQNIAANAAPLQQFAMTGKISNGFYRI
jgi:hypothetical protein